jgi:hypothetical protein
MLAQGHDLGLSSELIDLVAFKHVQVNHLDRHSPVQRFVVGVVDHSRGAISYIQGVQAMETSVSQSDM